jgi:hypothetical protein
LWGAALRIDRSFSGFRRRTGPCASALRQRQREDCAAGAQRDDETDNIAKDAFHCVSPGSVSKLSRDMGSPVSFDNIPRLVIFARAKATIEVALYAIIGEALFSAGETRETAENCRLTAIFSAKWRQGVGLEMLHMRRISPLWTVGPRAINCRP